MSDQRTWSSVLQNRRWLSAIPTTIESLAFILILIVAYALRLGLPTVPISDPDSWGYLHPTISWLSDKGFQQTNGRDWLYPAMVAVFIKTTGSISGIITWQLALGVVGVAFMAVAWRFWVALLPLSRWLQLPVALVGLLPIYLQQINIQNIVFELEIRPEAVLNVFIYAQLASLMGFCYYRWKNPRPLASLIFGGLAIVFAFATLALKPSWLFALVTTTAPVWFGIFASRMPLSVRLGTPALGVFLTGVLLWLPAKATYIKDSASRTFLPATLLTIHADLIEKDLIRKIAAMPESNPERQKNEVFLHELQKELRKAETISHGYEKLGFDPDYLFYHCPFISFVWAQNGYDTETFRSFCLGVYTDALLHNPLGFGRKILNQFTHFLFLEPSTFYRNRVDLKKLYRISHESINPEIIASYPAEVRAMIDAYVADTVPLTERPYELKSKSFAKGFTKSLTAWVLPLEIFFILTFCVCLCVPSWLGLRLGGWATLIIFSAPAANALTVCVAHALDLARYRYSYGGVLLFAVIAMMVYLVVVFCMAAKPTVERFISAGFKSGF